MTDPDIPDFLSNLQRLPPQNRPTIPFLGFDENLNNDNIKAVAHSLVSQGKIQMSSPLWYKTRVSQLTSEVLFSKLGGVDPDTRIPEEISKTLGTDQRGAKWSDRRIIGYLISYFMYFDHLVLLSADLRRNKEGLWAILHTEIKQYVPQGSSLTVLFKDGEDIDVYCQKVQDFFDRQSEFRPGYFEHRLSC